MKRLLRPLASPVLMLGGFALLAIALLLPGRMEAPLVAVLAVLALNLAAAIALHPALRRGGLGVFHAALLTLLLLAGAGRLTHFDARVEITEDSVLDPSDIELTAQGRWHGDGWRRLTFRQGSWDVSYAPGVKRTRTRSRVWLPGEAAPRLVGDDTPVLLDGYRLYTTHNKGFAPLLTWQPVGGTAVQGALHMPSYPLFDWKQENDWTAPDGRLLRFWLRLERPLQEHVAWTLAPRDIPAVLVVETGGVRHELRPGDALALPGAQLRYDRLAGWMGYRIFYDPTLLPMLAVAVLGVLGLGWHLWGGRTRWLPVPRGAIA